MLLPLGRFISDFREYCLAWGQFFSTIGLALFSRFETAKNFLVIHLYRRRGKLVAPFVHSGMGALTALGVAIAPVLAEEFPNRVQDPWSTPTPSAVLSSATTNPTVTTLISDKPRDRIIIYTVQEGDTISTIAEKFGVSIDTIRWQNDLQSIGSIKPGQELKILPVTGISHKVQKGDTIYSIAKKYDGNPQAIVDFPFNTFINDETFALAVGQTIIVPNGVKPQVKPWSPIASIRQTTPDAGTVTASGRFIWPTQGQITQNFVWYHRGIDIANRAAPQVLAADSGRVIVAGWPDAGGYGNRVMIDHGNGYVTLYAHLSRVYVAVGQTVNRGDAIGQMGSTGRSTGIHLHFEVRHQGAFLNPLQVLK